MKLLIHAGIHRTGTTSLQRFLTRNREALAHSGIAYPGTGENHQSLVWSLKRGESDGGDVAALLSGASGAETAVLSGEDFCIHTDLSWLARVAALHDTEAVFYLRRQDHWVMSWYNQHVKWPFDRKKSQMDPQAFLAAIGDFYWLDYARTLKRWCDTLGQSRVHVRVVEKGQVEDVTGDFIDLLGVDRDTLAFDDKRANDSLPVHTLEIARHLNLNDMRPGQRMRMIAALREGLADKTPAANTLYSPQERRAVLERFAATNATVARVFFGREKLFLEPAPAADAPVFRFPELSQDDLMREWIAPVMWRLLTQKRVGKKA